MEDENSGYRGPLLDRGSGRLISMLDIDNCIISSFDTKAPQNARDERKRRDMLIGEYGFDC